MIKRDKIYIGIIVLLLTIIIIGVLLYEGRKRIVYEILSEENMDVNRVVRHFNGADYDNSMYGEKGEITEQILDIDEEKEFFFVFAPMKSEGGMPCLVHRILINYHIYLSIFPYTAFQKP